MSLSRRFFACEFSLNLPPPLRPALRSLQAKDGSRKWNQSRPDRTRFFDLPQTCFMRRKKFFTKAPRNPNRSRTFFKKSCEYVSIVIDAILWKSKIKCRPRAVLEAANLSIGCVDSRRSLDLIQLAERCQSSACTKIF